MIADRTSKGPVLLAILDGWGCGAPGTGNAIHLARKPNMDRWWRDYPHTTLCAHGEAVGLPAGQMGNSEVGHLNIGAGRVVYQDLTRINRALARGDFFDNEVLVGVMSRCREKDRTLHLLGLLSDGGVHSHFDHLVGLLEMAARQGLHKVLIHAFMDGRDTPPSSGKHYLEKLEAAMERIGVGRIATISGRYYAMDRDNRWERVELAWRAMVLGKGVVSADPRVAIFHAYEHGETDEFVKPTVIVGEDGRLSHITSGDSVIFFNFRADRARQLTRIFTSADFTGFDREGRPELAEFVTFTSYDKEFDLPVAFPPVALTHILGEEVSRHGLPQLRIAETEKYAHVTFFFNGGREKPYDGEERVLIPSPREVSTYDQKPEMSARLVTEELLARLAEKRYRLIVLNFANCDMVGHSGVLAAAIKACETVDECLGRLVAEVLRQDGVALVTADHGNAEIMVDPDGGGPFTAHSANPVPFLLIDREHQGGRLAEGGTLRDIAPTILELLQLPVPTEMDGRSLIAG
jgi:2,3-bisphosphoglycerate-independent phosphoglycerate mutase